MQLKSLEGMRLHYSYNDRKEVYGARKEKRSGSTYCLAYLLRKTFGEGFYLTLQMKLPTYTQWHFIYLLLKGISVTLKMIFSRSFFTPDKRIFTWVHKLPSFVYFYHDNNEH